jgi:hypothetical protein
MMPWDWRRTTIRTITAPWNLRRIAIGSMTMTLWIPWRRRIRMNNDGDEEKWYSQSRANQ